MKPFVSVIIPTYHDWERLKMCLTALRAQTYPQGRFEVIVVNNDHQDPVPEMELPNNFQILSESKPGSYAARNKGISVAIGEVFAFTDSDCIPQKDWIEKAVVRLLDGAERIAGHVELFFQSGKLTPVEIFEKAFEFPQERYARTGGAVTANMFTWSRHFQKVGLFNESMRSGGDNEWGWRALALGIPITFSPDVVVKHPARSTMAELIKKRERVVGGLEFISSTTKKDPPFWLIRGFLPPIHSLILLSGRKDLSFHEKVVAFSIKYYLKIFSTIQKIRIRLGKISRNKNK